MLSLDPPATVSVNEAVGAIVPHAGWRYSGQVAFEALSALATQNPNPALVIVFGGHLGPRDLTRVFIEGAWDTPYGPANIAADLAQDVSMVVESEPENPDEYYDDNAIEVLMPMVKKLWPKAQFLTVGVPPTPDATKIGAEVIDRARARDFERIVVVGSTDLTHYGPNYDFQPAGRGPKGLQWVKTKNDPQMIAHLERLDATNVLWDGPRSRNACCPGAIAATIAAVKKLGAQAGAVTRYTTSYDVHPTEPVPMSFVGYVGVVLGKS